MLNERKLTTDELAAREKIIQGIKKDKLDLVKKYGSEAERVMYGRATNIIKQRAKALKQSNDMKDDKLKKMIQDALMNPKEADLNKDGELSSYEKTRGAAIEKAMQKEDLDLGHKDNEPHMIKAELAQIGKYAMELYKMVDQFEGPQEVDFPAWWQGKITTAKNMVSSAKHYLEFELEEPKIDAMVNVASQEGAIDEEMTPQKSKKIGMSFEGIDKAMVATLTEKIMKRLKTEI